MKPVLLLLLLTAACGRPILVEGQAEPRHEVQIAWKGAPTPAEEALLTAFIEGLGPVGYLDGLAALGPEEAAGWSVVPGRDTLPGVFVLEVAAPLQWEGLLGAARALVDHSAGGPAVAACNEARNRWTSVSYTIAGQRWGLPQYLAGGRCWPAFPWEHP